MIEPHHFPLATTIHQRSTHRLGQRKHIDRKALHSYNKCLLSLGTGMSSHVLNALAKVGTTLYSQSQAGSLVLILKAYDMIRRSLKTCSFTCAHSGAELGSP